MTYEEALEELQEIANAMERETVNVDSVAERMKRAAELLAFCRNKLRGLEENLSAMEEV